MPIYYTLKLCLNMQTSNSKYMPKALRQTSNISEQNIIHLNACALFWIHAKISFSPQIFA